MPPPFLGPAPAFGPSPAVHDRVGDLQSPNFGTPDVSASSCFISPSSSCGARPPGASDSREASRAARVEESIVFKKDGRPKPWGVFLPKIHVLGKNIMLKLFGGPWRIGSNASKRTSLGSTVSRCFRSRVVPSREPLSESSRASSGTAFCSPITFRVPSYFHSYWGSQGSHDLLHFLSIAQQRGKDWKKHPPSRAQLEASGGERKRKKWKLSEPDAHLRALTIPVSSGAFNATA